MISSYLFVRKQSILKLLVLSTVIGLAACGGGGGKSSSIPTPTSNPTTVPTPAPDVTPADFSFTLPQGGVYTPGEMATTDPITITDIDELVDIAISAGGEYAIDNGSFTSSKGQIANNQSLVARAAAPANFGETLKVTLTVGTVEQSFTVASIAQDITPDTFSFTSLSDFALSTSAVSNAITITGINDAAPVTIEGGEYAIADGEYTDAEGTVTKDQTITVRLATSSDFSKTSTAKLTVGGVEAVFSVTTLARDVTPDAFTIDFVSDIELGAVAVSSPISLEGFNDSVEVVIDSGGSCAVGEADTFAASCNVAPGQTFRVRGTAPTQPSLSTEILVAINGVTATFVINSVVDNTQPTAVIAFPPPISMTDSSTMFVRGSASDDLSDIASITVLVNEMDSGVEITSEDGFATWGEEIPLNDGDNTITLAVTDKAGNTNPNAATVYIRKGTQNEVFPAGESSYVNPMDIELIPGEQGGVNILASAHGKTDIYFVNTQTGERETHALADLPATIDMLFDIQFNAQQNVLYFVGANFNSGVFSYYLGSADVSDWSVNGLLELPAIDFGDVGLSPGLAFDATASKLFVTSYETEKVFEVPLDLSSYSEFSGPTLPDDDSPLINPYKIFLSNVSHKAYVTSSSLYDPPSLYEIDLDTGKRKLLFSGSEATGRLGELEGFMSAGYIDHSTDVPRALVCSNRSEFMVWVDTISGDAEVFSDVSDLRWAEGYGCAGNLQGHESLGYVFVARSILLAITAVDLVSGRRVVVSKYAPGIDD